MRRLLNHHLERKAELVAKAISAANVLHQEATQYELDLDSDGQTFVQARDTYNQVVEEINSFIQAVASDQDAYFQDRSEGWQESESGREHQAWQAEWDVEIGSCDLEAER